MNKFVTIALVAVLAVSVSMVSIHNSTVRAADCSNAQAVLDGHILSSGEFGGGALAVVTNSSDCSFNVGLDDYLTSNNQRYDSKGTVIGPKQSVEIHINVPDCQYRLELTTDLTVLDSQIVRSNSCAPAATPTPVAPTPVPPTPVPPAPVCTTGTVTVTVNGPQSAAYYVTRPNGTTFGWNGSHSFAGQGPLGVYSIKADTIPGFNAPTINQTSGTLDCNGNLQFVITYTQITAPTPVPPTPVPTYTPIPVPTYVPVAPNPVSFIFSAPCTGNSSTFSNSCNTTTTNTVNNTSTITQSGNGNNAQVNQSGAAGGTYSGTQQNLYLPWMASAVVAPTPTPIYYPPVQNAYLSISKMVRNLSGNTSEVKSVNANVNDTVEFVIRVSSSNGQSANNVRVTDSLPYGLTYVNGSTTVDNSYMNDGITSSGLNLGSFYAGRLATIRFRATVGQSYSQYGYNYNSYNTYSTTLTNSATVYADNAPSATDSATVLVGSYTTPNQQALSIQKTARNISRGDTTPATSLTARAGDGIEFTLVVTAPYNTNLNNVVISDALPAGMNYTVGSTTLNNNRINDGIVSGGVNIGSLYAGQTATVVFYATINPGVGAGQVLVNTGSVRADNAAPATSNPVQITIGNYSVIAGGLHVKTGPTGDAFAIAGFGALMTSAIYVGKRKGFASLIKLA